MLTPSPEQQLIIDTIASGSNVAVSAVAGSGKTTTVLSLAKKVFPKKILQLTYNKLLKMEVRDRVVKEDITNVEIHTYHSLAVKYYDKKAFTDDVLQTVIKAGRPPQKAIHLFDYFVLDENQDMTPLLFLFVQMFLAHYGKAPQLVLLGDPRQAIYEFKGADSRFLTLGPTLWNSKPMIQLPLSTSYRVTKQIATFVNEVMLGEPFIHATKEGPPVDYIRCNPFQVQAAFTILKTLLHNGTYKPEDIFILAPSIKNASGKDMPINKLENLLVHEGIKCFVPTSDEGDMSDDVVEGKVVFSSIHQSKGRERKVVVLFGFDAGWFQHFGKTKVRTRCPNELYVAVTRAKERLILLESANERPLPFLKKTPTELLTADYVRYQGSAVPFQGSAYSVKSSTTTPTDLLKFVSEEFLAYLLIIKEAVYTLINPKEIDVDIPGSVVTQSGTTELVSDLNGVAIPMMWETALAERHTLFEMVQEERNRSKFIAKEVAKLGPHCTTVAQYLHLAALWQAITTCYNSKLAQIQTYDWLTPDMVKACHGILAKHLTEDATYEVGIGVDDCVVKDYGTVQVTGRMDAVTDTVVWELKCVKELQLEHFLQPIIYAWMWQRRFEESRIFRLMNMRTGEVWELDSSSHYIKEAVDILLHNKFKVRCVQSDAEFLEQCREQGFVLEDDLPISNEELADVNLAIFKVSELELICRARNIKKISGKNKETLIGMIEADKTATAATATAATVATATAATVATTATVAIAVPIKGTLESYWKK